MNDFIFDVDGTLIDSEKMYMLPLQKVLTKHGYHVADTELEKVFGITAADALKILGVKSPNQIQKEWFAEIANFKQYAHVYPGIKTAFVFSNEIKRGKPAPDLVLKGMEKLSASRKSTIYVGDTIYDMQAAHAANVAFGLAGWRTKKTPAFKDVDYYFEAPEEMLKISALSH